MTCFTGYLRVLSQQRESGLMVVEGGVGFCGPGVGLMTIRAIHAQTSLMGILMAVDATVVGHGTITNEVYAVGQGLGRMAGSTIHPSVSALQREASFLVIETRCGCEVFLIVAVAAVVT